MYEFHGCPRCHPNERNAKLAVRPDRTLEELYQDTLVKTQTLFSAGYTVAEMWECEWDTGG